MCVMLASVGCTCSSLQVHRCSHIDELQMSNEHGIPYSVLLFRCWCHICTKCRRRQQLVMHPAVLPALNRAAIPASMCVDSCAVSHNILVCWQ
jgi:hypothetical protein